MAYTTINYRTKSGLTRDVITGRVVEVYQPRVEGNMPVPDGIAYLEGPHYPEPHKWYARVQVQDGRVVKVLR